MKIKILLLASNPKDTNGLRLSEEFRDIKESIKLSENQHDFDIIEGHAVRAKDLRRLILEKTPHIIHYSGHGETEGILLEDEQGNSHPVGARALEELFGLFDSINCVIFNSCYSAAQAKALKKVVPYVIGMTNSIKDKSAIDFSVGFYDAIASKRSIEDSFVFGLNAIRLQSSDDKLFRSLDLNNVAAPEEDIPLLIKGDIERSLPSFEPIQIKNQWMDKKRLLFYFFSALLLTSLMAFRYFSTNETKPNVTVTKTETKPNVTVTKTETDAELIKRLRRLGVEFSVSEEKTYKKILSHLWPLGKKIKIAFLDGEQKDIDYVKAVSKEWLKHANIDFEYVDKESKSDARVTFTNDLTYLGKGSLDRSQDEATLGVGSLLSLNLENEKRRLILHEYGHLLGLIHEHQTPNALLQIDWEKAYEYFAMLPDQWSRADVDLNLRSPHKLPSSLYVNKPFDPSSVMSYKLPAEILGTPVSFPSTGFLSEGDIEFIKKLYPK